MRYTGVKNNQNTDFYLTSNYNELWLGCPKPKNANSMPYRCNIGSYILLERIFNDEKIGLKKKIFFDQSESWDHFYWKKVDFWRLRFERPISRERARKKSLYGSNSVQISTGSGGQIALFLYWPIREWYLHQKLEIK